MLGLCQRFGYYYLPTFVDGFIIMIIVVVVVIVVAVMVVVADLL